MERREQILCAKLVMDYNDESVPAEERLLVSAHNTRVVRAKTEGEWLGTLRRGYEGRQGKEEENGWCRGCGYRPPEEAAREAQRRLPEGWVAVGFEM